jgi:hypothetical protein
MIAYFLIASTYSVILARLLVFQKKISKFFEHLTNPILRFNTPKEGWGIQIMERNGSDLLIVQLRDDLLNNRPQQVSTIVVACWIL